jgi:MoxR-like ATPase
MNGRPAVGFEDIKRLAVPVLAHRLVLTYEAQLAGKTAVTLLEGLLAEIPEAV